MIETRKVLKFVLVGIAMEVSSVFLKKILDMPLVPVSFWKDCIITLPHFMMGMAAYHYLFR